MRGKESPSSCPNYTPTSPSTPTPRLPAQRMALSCPLLLLFALAAAAIGACPVPTSTLHVSPSGNDSPTCGSHDTPCRTLRFGVRAASERAAPGDRALTVALAPGVYGADSCNTTVETTMSIVGSGSGNTTIDCGGTSRAVQVVAPGVSLCMQGVSVTGGVVNESSIGGGVGGGVGIVWSMPANQTLVNATVALSDVMLYNNTVSCMVECVKHWCPPCGGGGFGVQLIGNGSFLRPEVSITDCSFTNNSVLQPSDTLHEHNGGGGVSVASGYDVAAIIGFRCTLAGSTFVGNHAQFDGGGVLVSLTPGSLAGTEVTVAGSSVVSNFGIFYSGAAMALRFLPGSLSAGFVFSASDSRFEDNVASGLDVLVSFSKTSGPVAAAFSNVAAVGNGRVGLRFTTTSNLGNAAAISMVVSECTLMDNGQSGFSASFSGDRVASSYFAFQDSLVARNQGDDGPGGITFTSQFFGRSVATRFAATRLTLVANGRGAGDPMSKNSGTALLSHFSFGDVEALVTTLSDSLATLQQDGALSAARMPVGLDVNMGMSSGVLTVVSGCVFTDNLMRQPEGMAGLGVSLQYFSLRDCLVLLQGCLFANNTCGSSCQATAASVSFYSVAGTEARATVELSGVVVHGNTEAPEYRSPTSGAVVVSARSPVASSLNISVHDSVLFNNTGGRLGALTVDTSGLQESNMSVTHVKHVVLSGNECHSEGGGASFFMPADAPRYVTDYTKPCPNGYRLWTPTSTLLLSDVEVIGNGARCDMCSGGGLAVEGGGVFTMENVHVINNTAGLHGGGLYLGPVSVEMVVGEGTVFEGNVGHDGSQIFSQSGGPLHWGRGSRLALDGAGAQVVVLEGGNVTADVPDASLLMTCPSGTSFRDSFALYGNRAYPETFRSWRARCQQLFVSTLQFECTPCGVGEYTLDPSGTNGTLASSLPATCVPCPYGALCDGTSAVTAVPGYWGSRHGGRYNFLACPTGYCCDGVDAPCVGMSACAPGHEGELCGACAAGYSVAVGSGACVPTSECSSGAWVWPAACVFAAVFAVALLRSSDVWAPSSVMPEGILKLSSYYFQAVRVVLATRPSHTSAVVASTLSVFSFSMPTSLRHGVCAVPGLTAVGKASLEFVLPLVIVAMMGLLFLVGGWLDARPWLPSWVRAVTCGRHAYSHLRPGLAHASYAAVLPADDDGPSAPLADVRRMPLRYRALGAAWNAFMLVYFNVAAATFELLRCVDIAGAEGRRLFIDGTVKCGYSGWQFPLVCVAVVLLVVPPGVMWRAGVLFRRRRSVGAQEVSFDAALYRAMAGMYTEEAHYWEGVLIGHRIVVAALYTFVVSTPVIRAGCLAIANTSMLALHASYRPMRHPAAGALQTVLLFCLVVASVVVIPSATAQELAVTVQQTAHKAVETATTAASVGVAVFGYGLPCVALGWVLVGKCRQGKCLRTGCVACRWFG